VLDRAALVGLLHTEGENRYTTHPALQWFFQELFEECYPVAARSPKTAQRGSLALSAPPETKAPPPAPKKERESGWDAAGKSLMGALGQWSGRGAFLGFGGSREEGPAARAGRAYVEVIGAFAVACAKRAEAGDAAALRELNTQESNLHHACRLACQLEWWSMAAKAARGLGVLYETGGRFAQWEALLEQLTPLCVERITQQSLPGREEFWRAVIGQGARLAHKNRKLTRAEKLQELCVRWDRQKAGSRDEKAGSKDEMATLSEDDDRETQRSLAGSLYSLSTILREQGTPSVKVDEEAVALRERLGEKKPASAWAYEIGQSYTEAPEIRELSQAERWLKRGLELISEDDRPGKAKCLAQLGRVAWVRFNEARRGDRPEAELRRYLNDARMYYQAALEYDPPDDFPKLAQHHEELGHISQAVGDFERAFPHYREAIRYHDLSEDHRSSGHTRFNLAIDLRNANRLAEARKYALAARESLERSGSSEHDIMRRIKMLLESIEQKLQAKRGLQ
jgi:tetratricopeptide (TPR) repeat protein